jgi:hypothetical protein
MADLLSVRQGYLTVIPNPLSQLTMKCVDQEGGDDLIDGNIVWTANNFIKVRLMPIWLATMN